MGCETSKPKKMTKEQQLEINQKQQQQRIQQLRRQNRQKQRVLERNYLDPNNNTMNNLKTLTKQFTIQSTMSKDFDECGEQTIQQEIQNILQQSQNMIPSYCVQEQFIEMRKEARGDEKICENPAPQLNGRDKSSLIQKRQVYKQQIENKLMEKQNIPKIFVNKKQDFMKNKSVNFDFGDQE